MNASFDSTRRRMLTAALGAAALSPLSTLSFAGAAGIFWGRLREW